MRKRTWALIICAFCIMSLAGCRSKVLEEAKTAVGTYNSQVVEYTGRVAEYNQRISEFIAEDQKLEETIALAQEEINKGEPPFDENTLTNLKDMLVEARDTQQAIPEQLLMYEELAVNDEASEEELQQLIEKTDTDMTAMNDTVVPDLPELPDYAEMIGKLVEAQMQYSDSVTGLKQVTAPTDDFVMERLQSVETITAMAPVTEDHDPNGKMNKQGGYIGCIYFADSQVNRSAIYLGDHPEDVIDVGCVGGGVLEIFPNVEDAEKRNSYLAGFDGTIFSNGSHYVVGTIVIRTAESLTATQQRELTEQITQALIEVKH